MLQVAEIRQKTNTYPKRDTQKLPVSGNSWEFSTLALRTDGLKYRREQKSKLFACALTQQQKHKGQLPLKGMKSEERLQRTDASNATHASSLYSQQDHQRWQHYTNALVEILLLKYPWQVSTKLSKWPLPVVPLYPSFHTHPPLVLWKKKSQGCHRQVHEASEVQFFCDEVLEAEETGLLKSLLQITADISNVHCKYSSQAQSP